MSFFDKNKIMQDIKNRFIASNSFEDAELYTNFNFSKYIRPSVFREDGIWMTNDGEFAWICELAPRIKMGSETAETFEQVLSKIPEGFYTQIILFGGKNIENLLAEYTKEHTKKDTPVVRKTVENYCNFLRQKTKEPINAMFSTQIKNNRVLFVLKNKNINKLNGIKRDVFNILNSNHFYPHTLSEYETKILFYEFTNANHDLQNIPEYNERKYFNQQILTSDNKIYAHKDCIVADGKYFKALTPMKLPKLAHISEFGNKLGDTISKGMDSNQFVDSYMITLNLVRTLSNEIASIKRAKQLVKSGGSTGTKIKREKTEIGSILENIEDRKPMFKVDLNIWVSGNTYNAAKANADRIKSFWQRKSQQGEHEIGGILLEDFSHQMMPLFIGSLPAGINEEYFKLITKSANENHFVDEVCQFLPLEADWKGNYPNQLFTSRRGQICGIDLFKSNTAKNAIIIAESGGGKSVLANYLASSEYSRKTRVFVIDVGGSYEKLCNEYGGLYIDLKMSSEISFNPFSGLQKTYKNSLIEKDPEKLMEMMKEIDELMDFIIGFIYLLGANLNKDVALTEEKYIRGKLQEILPKLLKDFAHERILEIHDIQTTILKDFADDEKLRNFAVHLTSWCKGGVYYKFVAGESTIDLTNPFVVLELQGIADKTELRDALIYLMTSNIASFIYNSNDPSQAYIVFIDEMHEYLGKSLMMELFFDKSYRKFRKYFAAIVGITQSFEDVFDIASGKESIAGKAINANSPWKFFLNQSDTAINAMIQSGLFSFTPYEEELLKSVKTEKGFYSEFFLITPSKEKVVCRFILDRYFYYLISSDSTDKEKISQIMTSYNLNVSDAIQYIVDNEIR